MKNLTLNLLFLVLLSNIPSIFGQDVPESNCTLVRDAFANSTSQFISCAIQNARPITLCENCVQQYIDVETSYKNLNDYADNGTKCIDNYVNLDRLGIVETLYDNSKHLWNKAKCYECFQFVNGSLSPNISVQTATFNRYFQDLMNCVNRTDLNDTSLCPVCMDSYLMLNEYYLKISDMNEQIGMCMDMVDLMNNTWSFWSDKCCKYRKHDEYMFIICTAATLVTTLLFYMLAYTCSTKKTPMILEQRRFAETLNKNNALNNEEEEND